MQIMVSSLFHRQKEIQGTACDGIDTIECHEALAFLDGAWYILQLGNAPLHDTLRDSQEIDSDSYIRQCDTSGEFERVDLIRLDRWWCIRLQG